jgi:hypothetical protein
MTRQARCSPRLITLMRHGRWGNRRGNELMPRKGHEAADRHSDDQRAYCRHDQPGKCRATRGPIDFDPAEAGSAIAAHANVNAQKLGMK